MLLDPKPSTLTAIQRNIGHLNKGWNLGSLEVELPKIPSPRCLKSHLELTFIGLLTLNTNIWDFLLCWCCLVMFSKFERRFAQVFREVSGTADSATVSLYWWSLLRILAKDNVNAAPKETATVQQNAGQPTLNPKPSESWKFFFNRENHTPLPWQLEIVTSFTDFWRS